MLSLKRLVELYVKGLPVGKMLLPFKADVQSFARSMDPNVGYLEQTDETKEHLMQHLKDMYEYYSGEDKVSKAWVKIIVGKALIKYRHELMKLIDVDAKKPHNILEEHWQNLKRKRGTKYAQMRSKAMRHCKEKIKKSMISCLVSFFARPLICGRQRSDS